jgi:hypothetical protein
VDIVSLGIEKSALVVFISHEIIVRKFVYIGNPVLSHEGPAGRCETQMCAEEKFLSRQLPNGTPPIHVLKGSAVTILVG